MYKKLVTEGKTNWKYLLIVVILSAIAGAGILAWQYLEIPKEEVKDETADWKTYKNDEYGFEIKHPNDWIMEIYKKAHEMAILQSLIKWYPPWIPPEKIDVVIEINVGKKQEGYSIPVILGFGKDITCENVEIGNLTFCKLVKKSEKLNIMDVISYSISKNDNIYTVGMFYDLPDSEIQLEFEIFNQMLSTFLFLEIEEKEISEREIYLKTEFPIDVWIKLQDTTPPPFTEEKLSPEETAFRGFKWYLGYEKGHKADYENPYFSDQYKEKLREIYEEKILLFDPMLFAQDISGIFKVQKAIITNNSAYLITTFKYMNNRNLKVNFLLINNQWRINDIQRVED